jgi:pyruvate/2-oxoglutarate dehydrogenase complex dihydrolipoamide dehydrogenase (E3) component
MSNKLNIKNKQDVVVIGGGTSGLMFALGAIQCGLKVTLVCKKNNFISSSLFSKEIPSKAFCYAAKLSHSIRQAKHFGLDAHLGPINLSKINNYIQNVITDLQQDKDLELFESLGGSIVIGEAKFINHNTIAVNNLQIHSNYFVIAAGTRSVTPNIANFDQSGFLNYAQLFHQEILPKRIIILGGRQESLEIAQSLARFGSKINMIFEEKRFLPQEDQELMNKLIAILEKENINCYFNTKMLQFYWQNKRKLIICQDHVGDQFVIDGDEILNLQTEQPNVESLNLNDANVKHTKEGILVNKKLQTSQRNIFAIGSIAKTPFKSIHLSEYQTNIILSNIAFNLPKNINYKLSPRILYTDPQLASVGIVTDKQNSQETKTLTFNFKNIDSAIYQKQTAGEIKVSCLHNKLLGASILGPIASEIINEYSFAIQAGVDLIEIANSIHPYHSLNQINKRVANKIFYQEKSTSAINLEKVLHKFHQMFVKLVTTIE